MDNLFSPCTRLHRRFERHQLLQELNLDVSTEDFLSAENAFTYADLYAMLENHNTLARLTPHASVARVDGLAVQAWNQLDESYRLSFSADGKEITAFAFSPEHLLEICDVVLRLLAVSVVHLVHLYTNAFYSASINATSLAYLMEQCQSLKSLTLTQIALNEDHIRVLGSYSRPDLEIVLNYCRLTSAGTSALALILGRNQGPTKLHSSYIDVVANGLRGNSRLKSWTTRTSDNLEVGNRQVLAIAGALPENRGLVDLLILCLGFRVSVETWDAFCDSLKAHPTLQVLDIRWPFMDDTTVRLKSRMQVLSDMVKVNTSIQTIFLHPRYSQHELFRGAVIPYVATNRYRPRVLAIQKTRPISYRAKVLGRALLAARSDANTFWMLLSGNAEIPLPSSTPVTAAATYNAVAKIAAVSASVMSALTTTLTGSLGSATSAATPSTASDDAFAPAVVAPAVVAAAAANVATPYAAQKRKARPLSD
jgi:hypothetical protein